MMDIVLEEKAPYLEQPRGYGCGEVRIGTNIDLGEDIYGLAYVSCFKDELIIKSYDILTGALWKEESESIKQKRDTFKAFRIKLDDEDEKELTSIQNKEDDDTLQ